MYVKKKTMDPGQKKKRKEQKKKISMVKERKKKRIDEKWKSKIFGEMVKERSEKVENNESEQYIQRLKISILLLQFVPYFL